MILLVLIAHTTNLNEHKKIKQTFPKFFTSLIYKC